MEFLRDLWGFLKERKILAFTHDNSFINYRY